MAFGTEAISTSLRSLYFDVFTCQFSSCTESSSLAAFFRNGTDHANKKDHLQMVLWFIVEVIMWRFQLHDIVVRIADMIVRDQVVVLSQVHRVIRTDHTKSECEIVGSGHGSRVRREIR